MVNVAVPEGLEDPRVGGGTSFEGSSFVWSEPPAAVAAEVEADDLLMPAHDAAASESPTTTYRCIASPSVEGPPCPTWGPEFAQPSRARAGRKAVCGSPRPLRGSLRGVRRGGSSC